MTPLFRAPVPIFASPLVDREKGTGILMVCTFGDATDVQWWREQSLPLRQIVGRGRPPRARDVRHATPSRACDPRAANAAYARARGQDGQGGAEDDRRAAARRPRALSAGDGRARARGRAAARSSTPSSSTRRATGRSSSSPRGSGSCASWTRRRLLVAAGRPHRLAPRLHAPPLPELDGEPAARLVHLPAALLRRALPGLVSRWTRRGATEFDRPILADAKSPARRSRRGRPSRLRRRRSATSPAASAPRRGRLRHLVHELSEPADRRRAGRRRRSATGGSSRWTCGRRATRSSAPGRSTRSSRRCCTRTRSPGGTWRSRAGCSIPTARRCRRARAT